MIRRMADFAPHDDRFDAGDWMPLPVVPPFVQRRLRDTSRMYCETVMTARGDRDKAVAAIRGPWTWWDSGRTAAFRVNADGSTEQTLKPVWWYIAKVGCRTLPAIALAGAPSAIRVPIHMSRDFVGLQTVDVFRGAHDSLTIRCRFHGVENHFPVGKRLVVPFHLRAESGTLPFPFPRGTGWIGLARLLAC